MTTREARRSQADATGQELARARLVGSALGRWFADHGRVFPWRGNADPYRTAIVEVLLQRTRAETVVVFAPRFFDAYPTVTHLRDANLVELEALLAPIGLQRRRAQSLKALAASLDADPGEPWESRPGVGQYVARAIRVAASGSPEAMVDSNFVRLLRRVFDGPWMSDYRYDQRLQALAVAVVQGGPESRTTNWAVLDLGATVCVPRRPRCHECPLANLCDEGLRQTRN